MDAAEKLTLKQKWSDHWDKKDKMFAPSKQMNLMGMLFFWAFTFSLLYTTLWILIPQLTQGNTRLSIPMNAVVYMIFVESVVNWCLAARPWTVRVNQEQAVQYTRRQDQLPEGWKNCVTCQLDLPPRAHHCKICNMCVLKRDHHCFFTGTCVGFNNQRNFIVFILYVALGSVYGVILITTYLHDLWPITSMSTAVNYVPFVAFWKFLTGFVSGSLFLLLLQFYICIMMFIVAGWFFVLEMYTVMVGITWHEAEKGNRKFQGINTNANLRSVFGPFWVVQFFCPIPTIQDGDGYKWETKKGNKSN